MRKTNCVIAALSFAMFVSAAYAGWQDQASRFDVGRLAHLGDSRAKGLAEAERGAPPPDLAAIHSVLDTQAVAGSAWFLHRHVALPHHAARRDDARQDLFLVPLPHFRTRRQSVFRKALGQPAQQRLLYPEGPGYVYLGASYVTGEKPHAYSGNGASAGSVATPDDQIGVLSLLSDGRARLELPFPLQELAFDVIELKR